MSDLYVIEADNTTRRFGESRHYVPSSGEDALPSSLAQLGQTIYRTGPSSGRVELDPQINSSELEVNLWVGEAAGWKWIDPPTPVVSIKRPAVYQYEPTPTSTTIGPWLHDTTQEWQAPEAVPVPTPGSRLDELRAGGAMREEALRSVINSEAIEGVDVPYDLAARLLNAVLQEPLPDIG